MDAMAQGDFKAAKVSFEKELARMPYDDELHSCWTQAHLHLGEVNDARRQVSLAWRTARRATGAGSRRQDGAPQARCQSPN